MNDRNKKLLMIRARDQAAEFVAELATPNPVIYAPMVRIESLKINHVPPNADMVIFTSSNAVRIYAKKTQNRNQTVLCVGSVTTRAAKMLGFKVSQTYETAEHLVASLSLPITKTVLYPRAETVSTDIAKELAQKGYTVSDVILYRQSFQALSDEGRHLIESHAVVAPILSHEIAKRFHETLISLKPYNLTLICISASIAAVFDNINDICIEIAHKPTREALINHVKINLSTSKSQQRL